MTINTAGGAGVDREEYVDATLRIEGWHDTPTQDLVTEIRGRGNTTWLAPKKPYRLRLGSGQATALLGMPQDRDWALLANHYDRSMLRNALALCLGSKLLRHSWTPRFEYAEVTLNGVPQGLYQVAEHLKIAPHRLDLVDDTLDPQNLAATFSVELDFPLSEPFASGDPFFVTNIYSQTYGFHSDLVDETNPLHQPQKDAIKAAMDAMEVALSGPGFADPVDGYAAHANVESMIDMYLLNELARNNDAYTRSSTYFHRPRDGKVTFGPPWDFDLGWGNMVPLDNHLPEGWWTAVRGLYFQRAFQDPAFRAQVRARWAELKQMLPGLMVYLDAQAANLREASARDAQVWPITDPTWKDGPTGIPTTTQAHVDHLRNWITVRAAWLDAQFNGPAGGPPPAQ